MIEVCADILLHQGTSYVAWARAETRATPFRLLRAALRMPAPFVELSGSARTSLQTLLQTAFRAIKLERSTVRGMVQGLGEQVHAGRVREAALAARLAESEATVAALRGQLEEAAATTAALRERVERADQLADQLSRRPDVDRNILRRCLSVALIGKPGHGLRRDIRKLLRRMASGKRTNRYLSASSKTRCLRPQSQFMSFLFFSRLPSTSNANILPIPQRLLLKIIAEDSLAVHQAHSQAVCPAPLRGAP